MEAQDCQSFTDMWLLRDEDICSNGMISNLFEVGVDDVEAF